MGVVLDQSPMIQSSDSAMSRYPPFVADLFTPTSVETIAVAKVLFDVELALVEAKLDLLEVEIALCERGMALCEVPQATALVTTLLDHYQQCSAQTQGEQHCTCIAYAMSQQCPPGE